jgi:type I restriction enzyme S subunit
VSDLPAKWAEVPLGVLGAWRSGGTPSKANMAWWRDGTVPWVSPKDMKSDIIEGSQDKISAEAVAEGAAELIPAGSLLIVTRSGILAHSTPVAVTAVEAAINQDLKALIPAKGIDAGFLAAQIRARSGELLAHARKAGTTVESLVLERLQSFPIRLAPERQQVLISAQLSRVRNRVQSAAAAAESVTAKVFKLREALADRVATGRLAASATASGAGGRPVRVREMIVEPGRTGLSVRGRLDPPGFRALRLSALRRPVVDMADIRYLPIDEARAAPLLLRSGDVLIGRGSGTRAFVGRASLVQKVPEPTIFPDTAYRVRLDPDVILPEWFVAVWNAPLTRQAFEGRIRTTAGIWKVAWKDLKEVGLTVPTLAEQADALEALRAATGRLDMALAKRDLGLRALERYEQIMLRRAFDGRLVAVSESDEDAAQIVMRAVETPEPSTRKPRKPQMPSPREAFQTLIEDWPEAGRSFEDIRALSQGRYDDLRDLIFEAIEGGEICQQFDPVRRMMLLMRRAS